VDIGERQRSSGGGGGGGVRRENALVVALVLGDDVVGAEVFLGVEAGALAHFAATIGAGQYVESVATGGFHVAGFHQESIDAVADDFGDAANVRCDDRDLAGHGFERGEAEGLELRRQQEEIGDGELFVDGVLFAEEEDIFLQTLFADEIFGGAALGAIADEHELCGHFGADEGEDFHGIREAFDRAKIREVHEDGLAIGRPLRTKGFVGLARVQIAVDEIGDDLDGAFDVELFEGLREEVVGDGGDAVALLDREARDRKVAAVAADQGDVRAVERGDEGKVTWSGHGAR